MTWLKYITNTSRNKHRVTIHKKYKWIHSEVTLHQHSLLTRKVFSRHNLTTQVFFSVSSGSSSSLHHLHLQVISIFNSYSSSSHIHHRIWIIIGSRSSSLDLDHHSIWIIIAGSSSLDHHGCYLMILLVTGRSTEPALFHVGCRPSLHVGLLPALISDPKSKWPTQHLYRIM